MRLGPSPDTVMTDWDRSRTRQERVGMHPALYGHGRLRVNPVRFTNKDHVVLSSKVIERAALGLVMHPGQLFVEPVKASEANRWHVSSDAALAGCATHVLFLHVFVSRQAGGWLCLLVGEVDVAALWACKESGLCHDSEWVKRRRTGAGWSSIRDGG